MTPATAACVYLCCFCGEMVPDPVDGRIWYLTLQREPRRPVQDLFSHVDCLRARVHDSIPLLSELETVGDHE